MLDELDWGHKVLLCSLGCFLPIVFLLFGDEGFVPTVLFSGPWWVWMCRLAGNKSIPDHEFYAGAVTGIIGVCMIFIMLEVWELRDVDLFGVKDKYVIEGDYDG